MDLTPELLLEAKFSPARRGYDMNEVDDFLERCAEGLDVLLARLKAEFTRAEKAEAALVELQARSMAPTASPTADTGLDTDRDTEAPDAPEAAPDAVPSARPVIEAAAEPAPVPAVERSEAPAPSAPAVEEPMRILIAAEKTAEAAIADARAEAERIRADAESVASTSRSEAETLLARARTEAEAEARRAGEEIRRGVEVEVLSLRKDRDALTADVRTLSRWLDDQRSRLRTTARDLQRLVDDPAALRELPTPELRTTDVGDDEVAVPDAHDEMDDADDGAPTEAVPVAEALSVFDDETDDDVVGASSSRPSAESDD